MIDPFVILICWQFVLLSLAIAGMTYPIRLLIEYVVKSAKSVSFWTDVVLPALPIGVGAIMACFTSFPTPDMIASPIAHLCWGLVAGMFSSTMFRLTKAVLKSGVLSQPVVAKPKTKPPVVSGRAGKPRKPKN